MVDKKRLEKKKLAFVGKMCYIVPGMRVVQCNVYPHFPFFRGGKNRPEISKNGALSRRCGAVMRGPLRLRRSAIGPSHERRNDLKKLIIPIVVPILALSLMIGQGEASAEETGKEEQAAVQAEGAGEILPLAFNTAVRKEERLSPSIVFTEYKSEKSELFLWNCLNKYAPNDVIGAGILGYFWRESFFRSDSVSGWATVLAETGEDICEQVTEEVDAGLADASSRDMFIYCIREQSGGYGLGQWFSMGYLETLYDYAREWGTSIGDAEMQCAFVVESLRQNQALWEQLLATDDPETAGELIAIYYDGTSVGVGYIGDKAKEYYEKYHVDERDPQLHLAYAA